MKHQGLKTEGRERFQPDPQGEKTYFKMFRELEKSFPSDDCFLDGKKSKKTSRPPLTGQQNYVLSTGLALWKKNVD